MRRFALCVWPLVPEGWRGEGAGEGGERGEGVTGAPVVERALEPLHARGHARVLVQHHEVPRKAADALGAHRVALVGHRGRADLRRLERLFHFLSMHTLSATGASTGLWGRGPHLEVGEEPEVGRELVRGGAEARERGEDVDVDLTRVGLGGDGVSVVET